MSDRHGHARSECEHGVVLAQCRCPALYRPLVEIVRPCPMGTAHLGMTVVHPLPPAEAIGDGLGQVPQDQAESLAAGLGDAEGHTGTPEPSEDGQRPFWLPELVWLGRAGESGLTDFAPVFTTDEDAAAWASKDPRRVIWSVAIPADTVVHRAEVIPARVQLKQVRP